MNRTYHTGRLTADPDIRISQSGKKVASFTLAVDDGKDAEGNKKTQFLDFTAFDNKAEFADRYLRKGRKVLVEGKLKKSSYERDGQKHYSVKVVADTIEFADSNPNAGQTAQVQPKQETYTKQVYTAETEQDFAQGIDITNADLPF